MAQEHLDVVRLLRRATVVAEAEVLADVRAEVVVVGRIPARVLALAGEREEDPPAALQRLTLVERRRIRPPIARKRDFHRQRGVLRGLRVGDKPLRRKRRVLRHRHGELREEDLVGTRGERRHRRLGRGGAQLRETRVPESVEVGGNRLARDVPDVRPGPAVPDDRAVLLGIAHLLPLRVEDIDREAHEAGPVRPRLHDERPVARRRALLDAPVVALPLPGEAAARHGAPRVVAVDERDRERHLLADAVVKRIAGGRADKRERFGVCGHDGRAPRQGEYGQFHLLHGGIIS